MTNPFDWKPEHLKGWLTSIGVGAVLGVVLGYFVTPHFYALSLTRWIERDPLDALIWAVLGGLVVGGVVYAIKVLR